MIPNKNLMVKIQSPCSKLKDLKFTGIFRVIYPRFSGKFQGVGSILITDYLGLYLIIRTQASKSSLGFSMVCVRSPLSTDLGTSIYITFGRPSFGQLNRPYSSDRNLLKDLFEMTDTQYFTVNLKFYSGHPVAREAQLC